VEQPDKIRVLIVDDIAETRENLRKLLSFAPDIEVIGAAASGEEGVELARETQPHVVLMDINLPGMDGITATEHIVREMPAAQIVILSVQGETGYMRRAMAAGARDFLVKPPSGDELLGTIRRVSEISRAQAALITAPPMIAEGGMAPSRRPRKRGAMLAVYAPKGGVGCTTVAVNLAIALQEQLGRARKVALLDGNLQFGDVGVMLNLQASRSIADLAVRPEELDADMLTSVLSPHPTGIRVLLAPPHPEAAENLRTGGDGTSLERRLRAIVEKMLAECDVVVVDTWSLIEDTTLTLLDAAELILLVITPAIPAIKSARLFLDVAYKLGYPREKIELVINKSDRRTGLRLDQIERALMPAVGHIPFDERAGIAAANRGVPLLMEERAKPLGQSLIRLAQSVSEKLERLVPDEGASEADWESAETSQRLLGRILGS